MQHLKDSIELEKKEKAKSFSECECLRFYTKFNNKTLERENSPIQFITIFFRNFNFRNFKKQKAMRGGGGVERLKFGNWAIP